MTIVFIAKYLAKLSPGEDFNLFYSCIAQLKLEAEQINDSIQEYIRCLSKETAEENDCKSDDLYSASTNMATTVAIFISYKVMFVNFSTQA